MVTWYIIREGLFWITVTLKLVGNCISIMNVLPLRIGHLIELVAILHLAARWRLYIWLILKLHIVQHLLSHWAPPSLLICFLSMHLFLCPRVKLLASLPDACSILLYPICLKLLHLLHVLHLLHLVQLVWRHVFDEILHSKWVMILVVVLCLDGSDFDDDVLDVLMEGLLELKELTFLKLVEILIEKGLLVWSVRWEASSSSLILVVIEYLSLLFEHSK